LIIYLVKDNELIPFSVHNSKPFFDKTKKLISEGQPVVIDHKQNALNTYWEYEFSENPKKYVSDITQDRFVDLKERSVNKLIDSKNFVYSQGSFDRIIKWRNIPLYKNCFDYSIYPTLLTEVKPKTIFELGTGLGASCIWYQDILKIEDCHINLKGILNFFDKQMIQGDYLIVEDNDETKQEIIQNFMKNKTYQVDTRYTDFFGYNNCSFVNGVFKKS
jgi:cephalosporin hydroxylase